MSSRSTNENAEIGQQAEEYVAREVDGIRTPNEWFDVEGRDGSIIEVKSTVDRLGYESRRGRFRLWKDQHEQLLDVDGTYWFLVEGVGTSTHSARWVQQIIDAHDLSWTSAGDHPQEVDQLKLVWSYVVDEP